MNTTTGSSRQSQLTKASGWLLLSAAGILSLPVAATLLDGQGSENWIIPAHLGGMTVVGALVGAWFPGFLLGTARRRALLGALSGLAAALLGELVFFLLLGGLRGA